MPETIEKTIEDARQSAAPDQKPEPKAEDESWAKEAYNAVTGRKSEPAKPEPKAQAKPEPKPDAKAAGEDEASGAPVQDREDLVLARRGLLRTGWDSADVDTLPEAVLLKSGRKAWETLEKMDKRFDELRGSPKRPAEDSKAPADGAARGAGQGTAEDADSDLIPAEVLEVLNDEDQKSLRKRVEDKIAEAAKLRESEAGQSAKALDEARSESFGLRCRIIQRELASEFPELAPEKPPQRFIDKLRKIAPRYDTSSEDGLRELFEDAAHAVYGKEQQQRLRQETITRNRAARTGAPDTRQASGVPVKTPTEDEFLKDAYDAVKSAGIGGIAAAQTVLARKHGTG